MLAAHAGADAVEPGDALSIDVDRVLVDGEGGLLLADAWNRRGRRKTAARGERLLLVDGGRLGRRDRPALVAFAQEHGATLGLDPASAGWASHVAVEEGLVGADDVVCALDAEAGALGGIGAAVIRCAPDEASDLLQQRFLEIKCPATVVVEVNGRLPRWLGPFDLALAVLDSVGGVEAARGRSLELQGSTIAALTVDDRMGLCGTLARAGIAGIIRPDEVTRVWLSARRRHGPPDSAPAAQGPAANGPAAQAAQGPSGTPGASGASPGAADAPAAGASAAPEPHVRIDARSLSLVTLDDPWPGKPVALGEAETPAITQVILAGRLSDLRLAAHALAERPLAAGLQLSVIPASRRVLVQALEEGLITQFVRSGAAVWPPGAPPPTAPKRERRVTTVPTSGTDLLCGAAVAGASALAGRLVDPETVRREVRRSAAIR